MNLKKSCEIPRSVDKYLPVDKSKAFQMPWNLRNTALSTSSLSNPQNDGPYCGLYIPVTGYRYFGRTYGPHLQRYT
jgi:hypothetical protein